MPDPYGFGMIVRLPATRYRSEHLCVLTTEGTKVAGNNDVWRYYAVTLDLPYMIVKIYSDDFIPVEPECCLMLDYIPLLHERVRNIDPAIIQRATMFRVTTKQVRVE